VTEKRVLVAGATGRLGVIADVLLARGHSVRAMTRDPTRPAAARLRRAGAEVVYGDFDDLDSVARASAGVFPSPIGIDRPLQQAAIADLAGLAAMAIERPDEFAGRRIRVASDELTAVDAADALTRVTGRPFSAHRVATDELGPALASLFTWLEETEQDVDLPALHRRYPEVGWHTYEAWVRTVLPRVRQEPDGS
jgi:uncharacterized protein YbjT (DUF2867 family)